MTATGVLDDAEVPDTGRYLFATPALINAVMALDTPKSREVLSTFARVTKVPQGRFYTVMDQKDGTTTGEESGGYVKNATSGEDINFMIIHKPALLQFTEHVVSKVFRPKEVQDADGWKFNYRSYGLAVVYENKGKGVNLHDKA